MRRVVRSSTAIALAAVLGIVPAALAGSAKPGSRYAGTGVDYMNNAPTWTAEGHGKITFQTAADGRTIRKFRGAYACYCNCGSGLYVAAAFIDINRDGSFAYRFNLKEKYGRDYVSISGHFLDHGSRAQVSYLVDFVGTGQHVSHPYSTSNARALGCASWVKGTVRAG